ncbi:hypothetical protein LTR08_000014 [Meristemomyces frigidus]|nr:hypothetical protein LTR08_000014 [Meristemomyces frigidus]
MELIYWPQATATANATANKNASAVSLTASSAQALVTAETLGTTFTSPTLYISYANVYAANGCSNVGTTISNTIVAIPPNQPLSSVYAGTIPCDAHFRWTEEWTATAPFNVSDLYTTPVPYSIYSSQPWCATYLRNQGCEGTCPTTAAYKPILVVPEKILQEMEPSWSTCYGDIRGVYDPPIALQPAASVVGPAGITTSAGSVQTQSASPASGPGPSTPSQTAQAATATTTVTADPDNEGSTSQTIPQPSRASQQQTSEQDPTSEAPGTTQHTAGADGSTSRGAGGILASVLGGGASSSPAEEVSTDSASGSPADPTQPPPYTSQSPADPTQSPVDPSQQTTADSSDLAQSAVASPRQTMAIVGSQEYTIAAASAAGSGSGIVVAQGGSSVTVIPGASAKSIGGQQVSAAAGGGAIVVGSGSDASTLVALPTAVAAPDQSIANAVTADAQAYSVISQGGVSSGVVVVANGDSTATLTAGGLATTFGSQIITAPQSGVVVIGSGSSAATIAPAQVSSIPQGESVVSVGGETFAAISVSDGIVLQNGASVLNAVGLWKLSF